MRIGWHVGRLMSGWFDERGEARESDRSRETCSSEKGSTIKEKKTRGPGEDRTGGLFCDDDAQRSVLPLKLRSSRHNFELWPITGAFLKHLVRKC